MYAPVRGTRLYFDIEGAGLVPDGPAMREKPVSFIIHGGPGGDHSGFKPVMSPLSDTAQLVYFDHRGQGRSGLADPGADPARFTLDENVEDMEALRRHLGLGPIVSVGTSYGGMVAMAHAARHPDAVSRLILIVTAAHGGFIPRAVEILRERGTEEQQCAFAAVLAGDIRTREELRHYYDVMGPLYALKHDPVAARATQGRAIHSPEPLNRAFGPSGFLLSFDLRPELGRITAPTLILAGKHDWICPPEFSREIAGLIRGSRLIEVENSSHSVRVDEPDVLLRALTEFITAR
jgi:proline iminopeptidase